MDDIVVELRKQLDTAVTEGKNEEIIDSLRAIGNLEISKDLLRTTLIGKSVGLLRNHKDKEVSKESNTLVNKWKDQHNIPKKITPQSESPTIEPYKSKSSAPTTTSSTSTSNNALKSSLSDSTKLTPSLKRKMEISDDEPTPISSSLSSSSSPLSISKQQNANNSNGKSSSGTNKNIRVSSGYTLPKLANEVRSKTMELFAQSLMIEIETPLHYNQAAEQIEEQLYQIYNGTTNEYKNKVRSIVFNLKNNQVLKNSVLDTSISITRFCSMDSNEMANKELKEEREKMLKYSKEAATLAKPEASTDQFQCGKCKQRKCTYYQLQTRSADEPLTTFVTCVNCNNRWKFC